MDDDVIRPAPDQCLQEDGIAPVEEPDIEITGPYLGKFASNLQMCILGTPLSELTRITVVVPEHPDAFGRKSAEQWNDERSDIIACMQHQIDLRSIQPRNGSLDHRQAIMRIGHQAYEHRSPPGILLSVTGI
jgi:hypothetical protein